MFSGTTFNANPIVHDLSSKKSSNTKAQNNFHGLEWLSFEQASDLEEDDTPEPITEEEVFDLIRSITDPEHPYTLESLLVVSEGQISINGNLINVQFTPTVPHCGMATVIGLCIRVRLIRSLPERFKVDINIKPGSHQSENAVNKQLNDKERVAAALENPNLLEVVEQCLASADGGGCEGHNH